MRNAKWHRLALAALIALAAAMPVAAQNPAPPPAPAAPPAPGSAKLLGTWEGTFATDGPSGNMSLTLAKEGATWKLTVALTGGDVPPPAEPREIVPDGEKIAWKQMYGEYDVAFKGTLSADGSQLTGTLEASQGGSYAGSGTFTLSKK